MHRFTTTLAALCALAGTLSAQTYQYDDGSSESSWGFPDLAQVGFLQAFPVAGGGSDFLRQFSVSIGQGPAVDGALDGLGLTLGVWADPDGDGDPADAVLLWQSSGLTVTQSNADVFVTYPITPAVIVTGSFFLGAVVDSGPGISPAGVDSNTPVIGLTWLFGDQTAASLDDLDANSFGPMQSWVVGAFLLRAGGGGQPGDLGTSICSPALPNSSGFPGSIAALGNADAANGAYAVLLRAWDLPPQQFGYFLAGQASGFIPMAGGSQGTLCIAQPQLRITPSLASSGAIGQLAWDVDPGNVDSLGAGQPGVDVIAAGQTWTFQCWHRDNNPGPTSNFTDAVEVLFL